MGLVVKVHYAEGAMKEGFTKLFHAHSHQLKVKAASTQGVRYYSFSTSLVLFSYLLWSHFFDSLFSFFLLFIYLFMRTLLLSFLPSPALSFSGDARRRRSVAGRWGWLGPVRDASGRVKAGDREGGAATRPSRQAHYAEGATESSTTCCWYGTESQGGEIAANDG